MEMVRACMRPAASASSGPRVLVLGGTGRVGGSTATALSQLRPDLNILIGGRNREKGMPLVSKLGQRSEFIHVDIRNSSRLKEVLEGEYFFWFF
uniref:Saccharopine dehydrogenase NADP binding domain-containing protein n=1 Tax=Aegilops tauschii subsp. strangulata TaxID=200361 RepID=A0A453KB26_AEGTS